MNRAFVFGMFGVILIGLVGGGILMLRLTLRKPRGKKERSVETQESSGPFCSRCGAAVFSGVLHRCIFSTK